MICDVERKYYWNLSIMEEYFQHNGKIEGKYKKYHYNGQIEIECEYINGIRNGFYREYDIDGSLRIEYYYINGIVKGQIVKKRSNGEYKYYHIN